MKIWLPTAPGSRDRVRILAPIGANPFDCIAGHPIIYIQMYSCIMLCLWLLFLPQLVVPPRYSSSSSQLHHHTASTVRTLCIRSSALLVLPLLVSLLQLSTVHNTLTRPGTRVWAPMLYTPQLPYLVQPKYSVGFQISIVDVISLIWWVCIIWWICIIHCATSRIIWWVCIRQTPDTAWSHKVRFET